MSIESIIDRGRARTADMFEQRDQWAVVYDLTETAQADGSLSTDWTEAGAAYVSFSPNPSVTLALYAAGQEPSGRREMQFVAPFDEIAARQVVDVTSGPEAGTRWRVLFVDRSDRIVVRALVEPFNDELS